MILFEKKNKYGSFNDLMDVSIETGDKWLDKKLNANICYGKGGGGSAPQDVPRTLRPYVTEVLDRAGDVYAPNRKYQQYQGERILGFSDQEQAAQQGIEGMVGRGISATPELTDASTYYAPALGLLGASTAQQMGASGLLGAISPTLGVSGAQLAQAGQTLGGVTQDIGRFRTGIGSAQQQALQAAEASRAGAGRANINELDIGRYVDPYQQQVIDIEKRQARQDALQAAQAIGAKSAGMGSFGGSRQAILEAQQASDLGTRLADIQTRGSQAAYQQALQTAKEQQQLQYGEDVAGLQRQSALGQALSGLAGQQGQFASQYGQVGSQLGQLSGQQAGIGQAFGDLAGQYGAGAGALGQQAAGLGSLSQAFGALGQQALGQGYREQGYLAGVGEQERGLGQQRADLAYSTFREQEQFPEQQLQRYSSLINAFPYQINQGTPGPSSLQQGIGTAVAIGGLGRGLDFFKKGGKINGEREGGLSSVVHRAPGGGISNLGLDASSSTEAYKKLLELMNQAPAFDREKKEASLKSEQGFQIAKLGADILAADPSRGALAAIGQAGSQNIEGLADINRRREGLDELERTAAVKDLLSEVTILEKLREAELAGQADISSLTGLSDAEFSGIETAVSELSDTAAKNVASFSPEERINLRRQATEMGITEYQQGTIKQSPAILDQRMGQIYRDLLIGGSAPVVTPDPANTPDPADTPDPAGSPDDRVGGRTVAEIREDLIRKREAARAAVGG